MPAALNLIGKRFNKLTVLSLHRTPRKNGESRRNWLCLCDCGNKSIATSYDLQHGRHKSCGCLQIASVTTHGQTANGKKHPSYGSWVAMRSRCNDKNNEGYPRYGGRGVTVCKRWDSFSQFNKDMGPKPTKNHSIERIDNDGHYESSNCKWATPKEQAQNRVNGTQNQISAWNKRSRNDLGRYC